MFVVVVVVAVNAIQMVNHAHLISGIIFAFALTQSSPLTECVNGFL